MHTFMPMGKTFENRREHEQGCVHTVNLDIHTHCVVRNIHT